MTQGGATDEGIAERCTVRDMQRRSATCHVFVNWQHSVDERRGDAVVQPRSQHCAVVRI